MPKIEGAGADKVVMPLRVGGKHMAMMAMRPLLVSFIDAYFGRPSSPLELENVEVTDDSAVAGRVVAEVEEKLGPTVLVVERKDGSLITRAARDIRIDIGDELVVVGQRNQLEQVEAEQEQAYVQP